jgi:hypothetical protein
MHHTQARQHPPASSALSRCTFANGARHHRRQPPAHAQAHNATHHTQPTHTTTVQAMHCIYNARQQQAPLSLCRALSSDQNQSLRRTTHDTPRNDGVRSPLLLLNKSFVHIPFDPRPPLCPPPYAQAVCHRPPLEKPQRRFLENSRTRERREETHTTSTQPEQSACLRLSPRGTMAATRQVEYHTLQVARESFFLDVR